ncbi:hypothetical protein M407DRAFT_34027 [Tulasnella calospora MUT 4182]|uniref:glutathione transferase n=1 Tax=Tulasnella calospora MUT 4182 TaxID=1051891 RepID=A0A0C3L3S5_9AGAM|nr:hypothetical protein M407DRAFT_34027 [Tulasnella calospora MUT 4182]
MTITLHYLNNSRAQRILWLLEELEVPYEVKRYERVNLLAPPEFYQVHPLGKSPVITDGDLTIAESGAIVEYVIAKYGKGKLQPLESGWLDNLYFLHYAEGTLMPLLAWKLILTKTPDYTPITVQPIAKEICKNLIAKIVDNRIVDNINLVGISFTPVPIPCIKCSLHLTTRLRKNSRSTQVAGLQGRASPQLQTS